MTRIEFRHEIKPLFDTYGLKINMTQDTFDIWYEHLGGYEANIVHKAISDHIAESAFVPTIAELKKSCESQIHEYKRETEYISTSWQNITLCRPSVEVTNEAYEDFMKYVSGFENRLERAHQVYKWVSEYHGEKTLGEMMKALCEKLKNQS